MIVRLELDTEKPTDREILALAMSRVLGTVAPEAPPENAATDELVHGRDTLRAMVEAWRFAGGFTALEVDPGHWAALVGYVAACRGLLPAVVAVWHVAGDALGSEADAERNARARAFAEELLPLAEAAGLSPSLSPWRPS